MCCQFQCLSKVWNLAFEESESEWVQMYPCISKHGTFRKKKTAILSLQMVFKLIFSANIYVVLEQELYTVCVQHLTANQTQIAKKTDHVQTLRQLHQPQSPLAQRIQLILHRGSGVKISLKVNPLQFLLL